MNIKIYDKDFNSLALLINSSSSSDFNELRYSNKINDIGDASFRVRIDNPKITTAVLRHYNKVEILDDNGTVRWIGVIVEKNISLNVVDVKCYSIAHILDKRVTGANDVYNGQANTAISSLLSAVNSSEDTGISAGDIDLTTAINMTFNRGKVWQSMRSIMSGVDGQLIINNDRTLDFKSVVGNDLTASVIFQFVKSNPELANILSFKVSDVGREIISKTYGESGAFTSAQENAIIKGLYGLLEEYVNFREINDQTTLDNSALHNNADSQISPTIVLSPTVPDNFEAGDIVNIKLDNGFIQLDGNYQIAEKSVDIVANTKSITIKINESIGNFTDDIKKLKNNIDLLNTSV